jgi:outer membrane protein assembly factor BamB
MVSSETHLADTFDPKTGKNIKWSARLGTETHSTPIVAGGRVYIGTNDGEPRDPTQPGDRGILMCFEEKTGRFLWQLVVPKREEDPYFDWPNTGISSPVTVEGDRVYLVNNRGVVMCLDARGPKEDKAAPPVLWSFDLTSGAGIWSHDAAHSSILVYGDYLYLNSSTGVDNTHRRIRTPDAPSLVVLDKRTGRLAARDDEHIAPNIFHNTWCSPSLAEINGRPLLFFAAGNGMVYAFEPLAKRAPETLPVHLKKIWQLDFDPTAPKEDVHKYITNRRESPSNFYAMPVVDHSRLYVAGGGDLWWGKNEAWLKCVDPTKSGDITTNGVLWSYPLQKHVLSTPAIHDGMLFIADCGRTFHCVDAKTGKPFWTHEIKGEVWASPLLADGKVYLGTRSGTFYIFATAREKTVLSEIDLGNPISATTTAANQVLFVATMTHLYAIRAE